jgi:hypothetical protein
MRLFSADFSNCGEHYKGLVKIFQPHSLGALPVISGRPGEAASGLGGKCSGKSGLRDDETRPRRTARWSAPASNGRLLGTSRFVQAAVMRNGVRKWAPAPSLSGFRQLLLQRLQGALEGFTSLPALRQGDFVKCIDGLRGRLYR